MEPLRVKKPAVVYAPTGYADDPPIAFDARLIGKERTSPGNIINFSTNKNLVATNYHQFEYVIKGAGYIEAEGKKIPISAGDFFFLRKSTQRVIHSDVQNPMEKFFITVKGPFCDGTISAYFPDSPFLICRCDVSTHFENMMTLCESGKIAANKLYNALSVEFLKMVQSVADALSPYGENQSTFSVDMIMRYLDENIYTDFSLDDIAETFFISPSNLVKIFKAKYNTTPMSFVRDRRIKLAKYYLRKTDLSVSQIADLVPLGNTKYFSKLFKSLTGMTPREYRNAKKASTTRR